MLLFAIPVRVRLRLGGTVKLLMKNGFNSFSELASIFWCFGTALAPPWRP
jgi:hypothetical protein